MEISPPDSLKQSPTVPPQGCTIGMPAVAVAVSPFAKDSRWLTLEVCREHARNKCTRTEHECRFAHPPPHIEVQNGRVTCCFDSIKGKCQRVEPPCKYLHPPQHLKEQLLQNGRNNLILRNLHMQALCSATMPPIVYHMGQPYLVQSAVPQYSAYYNPVLTTTNGMVDATGVPMQVSIPALPAPPTSGMEHCIMPNISMATVVNPGNQNKTECVEPETRCITSSSSCVSNGCHYWTTSVPPSSLYPVQEAPIPNAHYFQPTVFQGVGAMSGVMPVYKRAPTIDNKNSSAGLYHAGSPTPYHQMASLQISPPPYYPMPVTFTTHAPMSAVPRY